MKIEPYLFFDGRCEEAMEFYRGALGAKVTFMMRYKENPEPAAPGMLPPDYGNKIMYANLHIGDTHVMVADGIYESHGFEGFSLSLTASDEKQAGKLFAALSDGGKVEVPLAKTFFSPCFGMVTDRFGVGWMVIVEAKKA
jgi:PhnB protein